MNKNIKSVYGVFSEKTKIKFHSQLKDSGIEFLKFFKVEDLYIGIEFYSIEFNNTAIRFVSQLGFLVQFSSFLQKNIKELEDEYDALMRIKPDKYTDTDRLEMDYKQLDYYIYKQGILLKKITELIENVKMKGDVKFFENKKNLNQPLFF